MLHDTLLEIDSLAYAAPGGRTLVRGVSATVGPSEALVVSGPNGIGKSTLLRVLLGRTPASEGTVAFGVPRQDVSYLPQLANGDFHLPMTLEDVIRVSLRGRYKRKAVLDLGLLEERHLKLAWNTASGGERQKTLLTRTILQDPSMMVLDEPMNHLDHQGRSRVRELLVDFIKAQGRRAVVLVSHERLTASDVRPMLLKPLDLGVFAC